jgi:hypothetical protein
MDTLEVYALNIQPNQIKKLLVISDQTLENIEKERQHFLQWLRDMYAGGARFLDQLVAWETYCLYIDFDLFDEIEEETNWMGDIELALESQIQPANYNEFRGQQ